MKHLNKISLVLILAVITYLAVKEFTTSSNRVGIVEMEDLVYEFQGMKDATDQYQKKLSEWSAQSDSLEQKLNTLYQEIKLDSISGDKEKLMKDQQKFYYIQKSYYEFKEKTTQKAKQDDQDMTIGVLNQLKEHMANFAKENGYEIIITNTQLQNVGYTTEQNDVTQEVLEFANNKYSGE